MSQTNGYNPVGGYSAGLRGWSRHQPMDAWALIKHAHNRFLGFERLAGLVDWHAAKIFFLT